ncbi:Cation/H(+) antiporter 15 [Sesamum alatum]|uniref:Cation/H(+) antiporter 15 n=1 Tax=Sesamum alatum TaxID=300844 RepID=A0AAE2CTB3_9LAMI|nr:Cation/H(+) antiporter 15 [Sesamum alatum]
MPNEVSVGNKFIVCQYKDNIATFGAWINRNPLNYSVPLVLLQLSAISIVSLFLEVCLQPLGQSSIVAQILGGILFGPSVLGREDIMGTTLFPARSIMTLETAATFGIVFFLFAIGVRTDTRMMVRPGRKALILGLSTMFFTFLFSISLATVLKSYVRMDDSLAFALPFLGASQSITAFSNVSCLLVELKMASSDVGRIAGSTAMLCEFISTALLIVVAGVLQSGFDPMKSACSISSAMLFVAVIIYIVGPVVNRIVRKIPTGKPLQEQFVFFCFSCTLLAAFVSEIVGQHFMLGPLAFGLVVPDGPPLGAPVISKLDWPIGKFLYPTFLTTSGLKTNIYKIHLRSLWIVSTLILLCCLIKIGVVVLASRFLNIYFQDSVVIGLIMNGKGICELIMFNMWRNGGVLTDEEFALSVISVIGVTAIVTPLIRLLHDPSRRHVQLKRRTIQHSKHDAELRILVCIKEQDNLPCIINILEASDAREESPIAVIAVLLEELGGRATNMLLAHQSTRILQPTDSKSDHIISALNQYELCNESCVTVQAFSAISHFQTVHDDICRLALDQNATILILPFHKHWEIDGSIGSVNRSVQNMNIKVLDSAPCSVGILVDRGILTGSLSILNNQAIYRVAVIYIGGPDDAESLCYGARMGRHTNVTLTIIRFLLYGYDSARDRKQDNSLIDEVRQANMGNQNFIYQEQVVKDGVGLAACLRSIDNCFDLLLVGRNHQASQIMMGLGAWSECPELGVIGDILSSPDFGSTASVLVVQQQRLHIDKLKNRMMRPVVISHESVHDYTSGRSVAVSVTSERDPKW